MTVEELIAAKQQFTQEYSDSQKLSETIAEYSRYLDDEFDEHLSTNPFPEQKRFKTTLGGLLGAPKKFPGKIP